MSDTKDKKRSSIITVIICVLVIAILAVIVIAILNSIESNDDENIQTDYVTNLDEEDMMQYEYSKIDESLDGMYAFAMLDGYIVGVIGNGEYVNIYKIDDSKEYDYLYDSAKLYLLEKESGMVTVVDLYNLGQVIENIELEGDISSFEVHEDDIYYISSNELKRYNNGQIETISEGSSKNFVIKNDCIYLVRYNNLIKIDEDKNETTIDTDVIELYYYDYYERDRLVYEKSSDGENIFKNVYNYYDSSIISSIKNDEYFVPYGASKYIYLTEDKKSVVMIKDSTINKYLYKSEDEIQSIVLFKDGYLQITTSKESILYNLSTEKEEESENLKNITKIKYLK